MSGLQTETAPTSSRRHDGGCRYDGCRGRGACSLVDAGDDPGGEVDDVVSDGEDGWMVRGDDDGFALVAEFLE